MHFPKEQGKCNIKWPAQIHEEDSFAKSNLCRRPFCPSLWLFSRGSALEIALQSASTLSNHQCILKKVFHLKLCELHFIVNGKRKLVWKKKMPFFSVFFIHCIVVCGNHHWAGVIRAFSVWHFSSGFCHFNFVPRLNEKHYYPRSIGEVFWGFTVMIS